jgi:CRP-like cAMP-binding protein
MFESFANYLRENAGLTSDELKQIEEVALVKRLRKRQYLLQEGNTSNYNCFVAKGCLRLYRVSDDGSEHILRFAVENWWMADYESYNSGRPSKNNIDALEDSELVLIQKEALDALCKSIPKLGAFKEQLEARSYNASQNRVLSMISETAEQKYENFMSTCPQIARRIPLHMIASFLGVSRETLSRVRQQYAR